MTGCQKGESMMTENTQPKRRVQAQDQSELERDLVELMEEQKNEVSAILSLLERMDTQERQPNYYVTSYPACNSEG